MNTNQYTQKTLEALQAAQQLGNQAVFLGLIIAELVVAFTLIGRVSKLSFTNASLLFILYSILTGATLSTIFLVYEIGSIASTFFVTAGTFGAMSLVGYFTHKDLSKMGTYLIMVPVSYTHLRAHET